MGDSTIYDTRYTIKRFEHLRAWQTAHNFTVSIYKTTHYFPKDELFGLTSQIRRAAVSIGSNIAEGFGRNTWQEKLHFYLIARGSLTEVQSQLFVAKDVGYITQEYFDDLFEESTGCHKLLSGLIKKTKEIKKQ